MPNLVQQEQEEGCLSADHTADPFSGEASGVVTWIPAESRPCEIFQMVAAAERDFVVSGKALALMIPASLFGWMSTTAWIGDCEMKLDSIDTGLRSECGQHLLVVFKQAGACKKSER